VRGAVCAPTPAFGRPATPAVRRCVKGAVPWQHRQAASRGSALWETLAGPYLCTHKACTNPGSRVRCRERRVSTGWANEFAGAQGGAAPGWAGDFVHQQQQQLIKQRHMQQLQQQGPGEAWAQELQQQQQQQQRPGEAWAQELQQAEATKARVHGWVGLPSLKAADMTLAACRESSVRPA